MKFDVFIRVKIIASDILFTTRFVVNKVIHIGLRCIVMSVMCITGFTYCVQFLCVLIISTLRDDLTLFINMTFVLYIKFKRYCCLLSTVLHTVFVLCVRICSLALIYVPPFPSFTPVVSKDLTGPD